MANEVNEDAVFTDEGAAEVETPETPEETAGEQVSGEGETPEQKSEDVEEVPEYLRGTPFRTPDALVKSYKDIQRLVAAKDREIQQGKQYLVGLAKQMMQTRQQQDQTGTSKKDVDPQQFWPDFWANPIAAIQKLATEIAESAVRQHIEPVVGNVQSLRNRSEVSDFISRHPEFTPELEEAMTETMQANPWLKDVPERLEVAYKLTLQGRQATAQRKEASVKAVKDAKQAAGMGGKRSALAVSQQGDEFDAVMDAAKAERELYKLGRS